MELNPEIYSVDLLYSWILFQSFIWEVNLDKSGLKFNAILNLVNA